MTRARRMTLATLATLASLAAMAVAGIAWSHGGVGVAGSPAPDGLARAPDPSPAPSAAPSPAVSAGGELEDDGGHEAPASEVDEDGEVES